MKSLDKEIKDKDQVVLFIKGHLESIIIAFVIALVIRCFLIDVFNIPTGSMEPTLMGDVVSGDRIISTRFFYELMPVKRYDVVVFRSPAYQSRTFIKRVVGVGEEELMIYKGDIYTRTTNPPQQEFHIARKPLHLQKYIWISDIEYQARNKNWQNLAHHSSIFQNKENFETYWQNLNFAEYKIENGALICDQDIEFRSPDIKLERVHRSEQHTPYKVNDIEIAVGFEVLEGDGKFLCQLVNLYGEFQAVFSLERNFLIQKLIDGTVKQYTITPFPVLERNQKYYLELMFYDGMLVCIVNGRKAVEEPIFNFKGQIHLDETRNCYATISSSNIKLKITDLQVYRDIHYYAKINFPEGKPLFVPKNHYVVIGDNVENSHDCRSWRKRKFIVKKGDKRVEIICESIEVKQRGNGQYLIEGDYTGKSWIFNQEEIEYEADPEPVCFIPRNFVIGKGLIVWWPLHRFLKLIK